MSLLDETLCSHRTYTLEQLANVAAEPGAPIIGLSLDTRDKRFSLIREGEYTELVSKLENQDKCASVTLEDVLESISGDWNWLSSDECKYIKFLKADNDKWYLFNRRNLAITLDTVRKQ